MLITGYDNDPLVDGVPFMSKSLFRPTYLASTVAVYDDTLVNAAFEVEHQEVMNYYRRLTDESRWPVFRMGLPDGHEIDVVYRNLPGEKGVDIVMCRPGGEHPLHLTTLEAHYSGPGLSWSELIFASSFSEASFGVVERDARLLLLLPALGDADLPGDAPSVLTATLRNCGAGSEAASLAETLLADPEEWPRWRHVDGVLVNDGRHSRRNPGARGAFGPDDLREISSALNPTRG